MPEYTVDVKVTVNVRSTHPSLTRNEAVELALKASSHNHNSPDHCSVLVSFGAEAEVTDQLVMSIYRKREVIDAG